jgi:hypothetical protein
MKKYSVLFLLFFIFSVASFGQQAPMGMKYQAVARDLKGNVLSDQQITLKITLAGNNNKSWTNYYSETHTVQTSQLGLFTLVVGEGVIMLGKFDDVPWSTEDIWMEVAIKDNTGFATISNSRLLAVPFAFHAMTANELVGTTSRNSPGVPAMQWSLFGNSNSNPANDVLGTTDNVDMVVVTNNIERLRLLANGNINIVRSLDIGANLKVDSNVVLNNKIGSTINNGPFTVARNSPTLLSGTLTVDLATDLNASLNVDGPTDLNSRLNVNNQKPTKLTGSLQVDGVTTLKDTSFVAGGKPTILTGSLRVDSNGTFKQHVDLDNAALNADTGTLAPTGALRVAGGGGIGKDFVVGGNMKIGKDLALGGKLSIRDTTSSTSTTTGALIVAGGVGIGKQLNIGNKLTVTSNTDYVAEFNNTTDANGISIKIAAATSKNANNFVTFRNANNDIVGRIEGETLDELHNSDDYKLDLKGMVYDVVSGAIDFGITSFNLGDRIAFQIEADASANACAGLGIVACPPIASFVAGSIAEVVVAGIEEAAVIAEVAVASTTLASWISNKDNSIGVTYQSGSGDYAEYLMKQQTDEKFFPGDIVGVKGGKISKNIDGAEKVMVVSMKPIVLGNTPVEGKEKNYEKVAFMGQVPVRVFGKVNLGDYIIPNGVNNGVGMAVSPDKINPADVKNIVGIAWSSSEKEMAINTINVAIGLNVNDNQGIIQQQQKEIDELKGQIAQTNAQLEKLIPGFKAPAATTSSVNTATYVPAGKNAAQIVTKNNNLAVPETIEVPVQLGPNEIHYVEATREDFVKGFEIAEQRMKANGDMARYEEFWKKYNSDPSYKELILNKIMMKYKQGLDDQKALDAKLNHR